MAQIPGTIFVSTTVQWTVQAENKNWLDFNKRLGPVKAGGGAQQQNLCYEVITAAEMGYKTQRMTDPPQVVLIHGCAQGQDGGKPAMTLNDITGKTTQMEHISEGSECSSNVLTQFLRTTQEHPSVRLRDSPLYFLAFTMLTWYANQESNSTADDKDVIKTQAHCET